MPKLKAGHVSPTTEEDAQSTRAALADPDAAPLTNAEWESVKPRARMGRPPLDAPKQAITIRLEPEVLARWRASGKGWQTRAAELLSRKAPKPP